MKLALIIIAVTSLFAFILFSYTTQQSSDIQLGMPWQVVVHDVDHSEVFGIVLNETSLQQAIETVGQLDSVALYQNDLGIFSLEVFFGKVSNGPLSARLIANLSADQEYLQKLSSGLKNPGRADNGSLKWVLNSEQLSLQQQLTLASLTFVPDYGGMDEAYIVQRFGPPKQRKMIDETSEFWFFPELGVRILVDKKGREIFEYVAPSQFSTVSGEQL